MNASEEHQIKSALDRLVEQTPEPGPTPDDMFLRHREPTSRWAPLAAVAAATVAVVGLGILVTNRDPGPGTSAELLGQTTPTATEVSGNASASLPGATGPEPDRYSTVDEVLDDFDRIEREVRQLDSSRQTKFYDTYFDCMATVGFDVPVDVRPTASETDPAPSFTRDVRANVAFESAPRSAVVESGYAIAAEPETATSESDVGPIAGDPLSQWIATLSPDQQAAYAVADMGGPDSPLIESTDGAAGMPAAGCNFDALQAAHGDVGSWFDATNELNAMQGLIMGAATNSDGYQTAVDRWAACLADRGIQIDNPDAMSGPVDQAVTDRDCRDQADLSDARNVALLTEANQQHDRLKRLVDDAARLTEINAD